MADRITDQLVKGSGAPINLSEVIGRAAIGRTTFGQALNQIKGQDLAQRTGEQTIGLRGRASERADERLAFDKLKYAAGQGDDRASAIWDQYDRAAKNLSPEDALSAQRDILNDSVLGGSGPRDAAEANERTSSILSKYRAKVEEKADWSFGNIYTDEKIHAGRQNKRTGMMQVLQGGKWVPVKDGRFIGKGGESEAGIASLLGDDFSLEPLPTEPTASVEFSQATGGTGFFGGIANTISDALGWGLQAPEVEIADAAIQKLMKQSNLVLAAEIPGRVSNYVRQRLQELEIDTRSLVEGDARALIKLKELRDFMAEQHNEAVWVASNAAFEQDDRTLAARNARQIRSLVGELDTIQQRWVEHEARIRGVGDEEEIEGVRVRRVK